MIVKKYFRKTSVTVVKVPSWLFYFFCHRITFYSFDFLYHSVFLCKIINRSLHWYFSYLPSIYQNKAFLVSTLANFIIPFRTKIEPLKRPDSIGIAIRPRYELAEMK